VGGVVIDYEFDQMKPQAWHHLDELYAGGYTPLLYYCTYMCAALK